MQRGGGPYIEHTRYKAGVTSDIIQIQHRYNTDTIPMQYQYNTDTMPIQYRYNTDITGEVGLELARSLAPVAIYRHPAVEMPLGAKSLQAIKCDNQSTVRPTTGRKPINQPVLPRSPLSFDFSITVCPAGLVVFRPLSCFDLRAPPAFANKQHTAETKTI